MISWVRDADMFPFGFPPWEGFEKDFVGMVGMGGHLLGASAPHMPSWFRPSDANNDVEDAKSG